MTKKGTFRMAFNSNQSIKIAFHRKNEIFYRHYS